MKIKAQKKGAADAGKTDFFLQQKRGNSQESGLFNPAVPVPHNYDQTPCQKHSNFASRK